MEPIKNKVEDNKQEDLNLHSQIKSLDSQSNFTSVSRKPSPPSARSKKYHRPDYVRNGKN